MLNPDARLRLLQSHCGGVSRHKHVCIVSLAVGFIKFFYVFTKMTVQAYSTHLDSAESDVFRP